MALSVSTLAGYFERLHRKVQGPGQFFDSSWDCNDAQPCDRLQWISQQFGLTEPDNCVDFTFTNLAERLILLSPIELKKVVCGLGALAMSCHLRHCIDGPFLRELRATIGSNAFDILLQRTDLQNTKPSTFEWTIDSLCINGLSQIIACAGPAQALPIKLLKLSLPRKFSTNLAVPKAKSSELPMADLKILYPEFRWLFG